MTMSMYQASVPVFIHMLESLSGLLDKAVAFCEAKKIEPSVLINSRLAPDMRPFSFQVQIACFGAHKSVSELAGLGPIPMPENETTFEQLKERVTRTLAFLKTVKPEQVEGTEGRTIQLKMGPVQELTFKGQAYLPHFVYFNFFFHVTTAYALLRHNGVELGKADYIGRFITE